MKDIALHLRYESKRTDLPKDVIRTLSKAYAKISRLERERDEARREVSMRSRKNPERQREFALGRGWDCFKEENNNG